MKVDRISVRALIVLASVLVASAVQGHGDVTPQAVDVSTLKALGTDWVRVNPYRDDAEAIRVGTSAYNQNCARCHGLEAISGGIAPDLRKLDLAPETDEYFRESVRRGKVRNGAVYMPPFEGVLPQEAIWAIKAYLETRRVEEAAPANDMQLLARKSTCLSCHAVDAKAVGPAYRDIAKKYEGDSGAELKLLRKLRNGGAGVWGTAAMPPMAHVPEEDLRALLKWILDGAQ